MSNTSNLDLERPDKGDPDWDVSLNSNMTKLDTGYGNNVASIADLPEMYIEAGTFNFTTGDVITLPKSVDAINEYSVTITPTTGAGVDIGFIYVSKAVDDFTVYCTGNNTTDTYSAVIYYIGDIASYGGSIYRRWYVSPDAGITDHSDDTDAGSFAWVLDQVGIGPAFIEFPGNKTYILTVNDVTVGENVILVFQPGAIIKPAAAKSLNVYSPEHIQVGKRQQIIDITNNSTDPLQFTKSGTVYPVWFNDDIGDGTTESTPAINLAIGTIPSHADFIKVKIPAGDYVCSTAILGEKNVWIQGDGEGTFLDFSALAVDENAIEFDQGANPLDDFVVSDLKIYGPGSGYTDGGSGILINSSHHERFIARNLRIERFAYGIWIDGQTIGEGPKVINCWLDRNSYAGIRLQDSQNSLISGNTIDGNRTGIGDGVDMKVGIWETPEEGGLGNLYNRLVNNTIYNFSAEGILVRGKHTTVTGNTISVGERGIVVEPFNNVAPTEDDGRMYATIMGNTVFSMSLDGITLSTDVVSITQGVSNCTVTGNTIYDIAKTTVDATGIRIGSSVDSPAGNNNIIIGNNIRDTYQGISARDSNNVQIIGNIIEGAEAYGIRVQECNIAGVIGGSVNTDGADPGYGIYISGGQDVSIDNVNVTDIDSYGMHIADSADSVTVSNCKVRDRKTITTMTRGINADASLTNFVYYNNLITGYSVAAVYNVEIVAAAPALPVLGPSVISGASNAVNATLADGVEVGAIKTIVLSDAANQPHTVTIAHHETEDSEVATFTAVDQYLTLQWTGTEWVTLGNSCSF